MATAGLRDEPRGEPPPLRRWADQPEVAGCYALLLLLEGASGLVLVSGGGPVLGSVGGLLVIASCAAAVWLWDRATPTSLAGQGASALYLSLPLLPLTAGGAGLAAAVLRLPDAVPWLPLLPLPAAALLTLQGLAALAVFWVRRPREGEAASPRDRGGRAPAPTSGERAEHRPRG